MPTQAQGRKTLYEELLKQGESPESRLMVNLQKEIQLDERQANLEKMSKKDPERYQILMSGPNANE